MNRRTLWMALVVTSALFYVGCGCGNSLKVEITQAPTTSAPLATSSVTAVVTHDKEAGGVNWSCTPVGTCGSFNPTQTASGVASVYTAPSTAGTVTIIATSVDKPSRFASTSVTITTATALNYTFYVTGEENDGAENDGSGDVYCIAGVVAIAQTASGDGSFAVVGGEQDYNDGDGHTATQDAFTGGNLVLAGDGSGNGTLTLVTASGEPGIDGTETFAVNFPNTNHALITQFDESATSSGSLDLQTSTALPSGSFAFTSTGASFTDDSDDEFVPTAFGGVITITSGAVTGLFDTNVGGNVTIGTTITSGDVTLGTPDNYGRGTINGSLAGSGSLVYYTVGPEVFRVIDTDSVGFDTAVGSAYGQGSATFSSGSIGQSVFSFGQAFTGYGAAGEFFTSAEDGAKPRAKPEGIGSACTGIGLCAFNGVGDLNELFAPVQLTAQPITGDFMVGTNGYGSLNFGDGVFGDVETFGVYAVDPALNILDPNDTTDGGGGALIAEMDPDLIGIGSIVPQTDTGVAHFNGTYSFGGQGDTTEEDEFDFLGGATASSDGTVIFNGTGAVADPFGALTDSPGDYSGVGFSGTATPDGTNPGRYTIPLLFNFDSDEFTAQTTIYQAYAGQLFWVETDDFSYFVGPLETLSGPYDYAKKRTKNKKH